MLYISLSYFQSLGRVLIFPLDVIRLTQSEIVNRRRNENSLLLLCDFYSFTKIPFSFDSFIEWKNFIIIAGHGGLRG